MISETIPQLQTLTPEQKLLLSNELWTEVQESMREAGGPDSTLVAKVRQRLREHEQHPEDVVTWEEIKARHRRGPDSHDAA